MIRPSIEAPGIRIYFLGACDVCGALSLVPDSPHWREDESDEFGSPVLRCAIVYGKDGGDEPCNGEVFCIGQLDVKKFGFGET